MNCVSGPSARAHHVPVGDFDLGKLARVDDSRAALHVVAKIGHVGRPRPRLVVVGIRREELAHSKGQPAIVPEVLGQRAPRVRRGVEATEVRRAREHTRRLRPATSEERVPRGCTSCELAVGAIEHEASLGERIDVRRFDVVLLVRVRCFRAPVVSYHVQQISTVVQLRR